LVKNNTIKIPNSKKQVPKEYNTNLQSQKTSSKGIQYKSQITKSKFQKNSDKGHWGLIMCLWGFSLVLVICVLVLSLVLVICILELYLGLVICYLVLSLGPCDLFLVLFFGSCNLFFLRLLFGSCDLIFGAFKQTT
jgi:hypothetical protein